MLLIDKTISQRHVNGCYFLLLQFDSNFKTPTISPLPRISLAAIPISTFSISSRVPRRRRFIVASVKDYYRLVNSVNILEPTLQSLSDDQLAAKTVEFRNRLAQGETLADIQPEAFAVVREAARRKVGMRHFDVQIIGGAVLHDGSIAEMKTGKEKPWSRHWLLILMP